MSASQSMARPHASLTRPSLENKIHSHGHSVQFYDDDADLLSGLSQFFQSSLQASETVLVIATPSHRDALAQRLQARGIALARARATSRYLELDAAETLSRITRDGWPDAALFQETIGSLALAAAGSGVRPRVVAFGEMVALLCFAGKVDAALRLEELWNSLIETHAFSLHCAYPLALFGQVGDETSLERICAAHTRIIPAESYMSLKTENERFRAVIRWQQKAQALESEIAEHQKAQEALQQRDAELADLLTEQTRMEQALRASVDQARAAVRARDDFLSIAAHELRTPVTALKGSAQLLARRQARGELTEGRLRPALAVIEDRANHLARLTSDLLDVSRLQGGQMALACTDLDLASLVQHAVRLARDQVDGKRVLDVSIPSQPTVVWGDAGRLDQVLTNLLDNALKYSPTEEPVTIHLDADADHELRLTVRDRGIGIPEGFLDQIFEPFGRAPNVAANHLPGMGLGLSICRRIVEQHGGRMWAESPGEGRGTTIVVCLPRYSSVTPMPQGS